MNKYPLPKYQDTVGDVMVAMGAGVVLAWVLVIWWFQ